MLLLGLRSYSTFIEQQQQAGVLHRRTNGVPAREKRWVIERCTESSKEKGTSDW